MNMKEWKQAVFACHPDRSSSADIDRFQALMLQRRKKDWSTSGPDQLHIVKVPFATWFSGGSLALTRLVKSVGEKQPKFTSVIEDVRLSRPGLPLNQPLWLGDESFGKAVLQLEEPGLRNSVLGTAGPGRNHLRMRIGVDTSTGVLVSRRFRHPQTGVTHRLVSKDPLVPESWYMLEGALVETGGGHIYVFTQEEPGTNESESQQREDLPVLVISLAKVPSHA